MYSEDDLLPLSGLQHMAFCERRWALVQIENIWRDNRFTAEGSVLHDKAHSGEIESRPGVLIRRTMPLHSFHLGLSGQADIIEFQPLKAEEPGVSLEGRRGFWRPYPIEYKRSRDKAGSIAYRVQLCAQALCLEEMLSAAVPEGAVYDGKTKRRQQVVFDSSLRTLVATLALRMHALFKAGSTPCPVLTKACQSCSLHDRCLPETLGITTTVQSYYRRFLQEDLD
ncbi:MAG: CRISPR-associated protein Cas4 [Bryobacteraceae bacterium]